MGETARACGKIAGAPQIANEIKAWDKNKNGVVDEAEGLSPIGWNFNKYDLPVSDEPEQLAERRAKALFAELDADEDGALNFTEAGTLLREHFDRADAEDKSADAIKLAATRTAAYIAAADKDGDGKISRQESRGTPLDRNFGRINQKVAQPRTKETNN